jgi:hypothetical protein
MAGFLDIPKHVRVVSDPSLELGLDRNLVKHLAGVSRYMLKRANHRVGLLGQVKEHLDGRGLNCRYPIECIDGVIKASSDIGVELADGVRLTARAYTELIQLSVRENELIEDISDRGIRHDYHSRSLIRV